MAFNGRAQLAYQFTELKDKSSVNIPFTAKKLELWLAQLPLLNTNQLANEIPKYIQEINQIKIADKQHFKMLELLRPIVAYLYEVLTKQFRGENLNLSKEYEERQWLANVLLAEMAVGYQRLLFNLADKSPNIFNRRHYSLLAERASYYLGERICLAYMLCTDVPKHIWHDLNSTYQFAQNLKLNTVRLKDDFAFDGIKKGSIDTLYKRVLLLSMVTPYSLRSAELEQIYYGFLPWLGSLKLLNTFSQSENAYMINLTKDHGPELGGILEPNTNILVIDNSSLVSKMKEWIDTGKAPSSVDYKGMSKKLLSDVVGQLSGSIQRSSERIGSDGEYVEVIIGLRNIERFLGAHNSEIDDENALSTSNFKDNSQVDTAKIEQEWTKKVGLDVWDEQYEIKTSNKKAPQRDQASFPRKVAEIGKFIFTIENESEKGVCLSCNGFDGAGLFIGELLFIRGYDPKIWTLGIVRWMKVGNKKLDIGLYLISTKVDRVQISRNSPAKNIIMTGLWLAEGEQGDTLLLPSAEFKKGDELYLDHHGNELNVILGDIVWHSEGFSQFYFKVITHEHQNEDYLIP